MKTLSKISFILLLTGLWSCSCSWHTNRATAKCGAILSVSDSVTKTDSISESVTERIVVKDTTIYITREGVVQYLPNPCSLLCDSLGNLKPFKSESKKNGVKSTIFSIGNVLAVDCKTDSLEHVIQLQNKVIERIRKEKHTSVSKHSEQIPVHIRTPFERFCIWWFFGSLVVVGVWVYFRFRG